jgi:hypothetical protein
MTDNLTSTQEQVLPFETLRPEYQACKLLKLQGDKDHLEFELKQSESLRNLEKEEVKALTNQLKSKIDELQSVNMRNAMLINKNNSLEGQLNELNGKYRNLMSQMHTQNLRQLDDFEVAFARSGIYLEEVVDMFQRGPCTGSRSM